jgi:ABC-type polysaccharide/polyol phosphate export permease
MGFMWAILMPLLIVLVGVLVRYAYALSSNMPLQTADIASVAIRSVPWAFTVSAIRMATNCLISNPSLVTKIYFPKEIFPLAAVAACLFDLVIASVPLAILVAVGGAQATMQLLWLPVLLLVLLSIVSGVYFFVSAASLFLRDVKYLVEVALTFGIFVTPVFFNAAMFGKYGVLMMANPVAPVLEGLEATVLRGEAPDLFWLGYSAVFGLASTLLGFAFFKRLEPSFAESI